MTRKITVELNGGLAFKLKSIMASRGLFDEEYMQTILEGLIRDSYDNLRQYDPEFVQAVKQHGFKRAWEMKQ